MSTSLTSLTRRTLIGGAAVAAGGLAVGIALPLAGRAQSAGKPAAAASKPRRTTPPGTAEGGGPHMSCGDSLSMG